MRAQHEHPGLLETGVFATSGGCISVLDGGGLAPHRAGRLFVVGLLRAQGGSRRHPGRPPGRQQRAEDRDGQPAQAKEC